MRIYSMTATFGKLEHETLTLKPGLNIIEAPNEWGKSTWCAFLVAMLYGLETRAKSTKNALADKERYAPWSGSPMAGRIDLNWNGRDITIERHTKRRVPLGEFRAYETSTGLEVPELTAANCGSTLLGVERSVFLRSGFIRFSDLPVTQDEALRRRLNALVTTGDENATADKLARGLRELKNRCRYNKSGLLPQAEAERSEIENKLRELALYENQLDSGNRRLSEIKLRLEKLENHRAALQYEAAQADADRVAYAKQARDEALRHLEEAQSQCGGLPPQEQTEWALSELRKLEQQRLDLQMEAHMAPQQPQPGAVPPAFAGKSAEEAVARAEEDRAQYAKLKQKKLLLPILAAILLIAGCVGSAWYRIPGVICAVIGAAVLTIWLADALRRKTAAEGLAEHYGSADPEEWVAMAGKFAVQCRAEADALERYQASRRDLNQRLGALEEKIRCVTQNRGLESCRRDWEGVIAAWTELADRGREYKKAESHLQTLQAMAKKAEKPAMPDDLTCSEAETVRYLSDALAEQHALQNRLGQYQGRMESLGQKAAMQARLAKVNARIARLEDAYAALTLAQETLTEAASELQRRFAPRITRRAQERMAAFTGGRYGRLSLGEDLALRAGAEREDVLHEALWRSDGTVDQLYLSLRLAVAEELTPNAPLILDDALVRFDDTRLKAAMDVLRSEAENKQVILFTCQSRENQWRKL